MIVILQESDHCNEDRRKYSQTGWMSDGSQKVANGHAGIISGGCLNESDHCTISEKCQHAFRNVLISDKFTSLCKLLFENFQGIKADLFDLSTINTRMKEGAYERTPVLFSSDIQQVILSFLFVLISYFSYLFIYLFIFIWSLIHSFDVSNSVIVCEILFIYFWSKNFYFGKNLQNPFFKYAYRHRYHPFTIFECLYNPLYHSYTFTHVNSDPDIYPKKNLILSTIFMYQTPESNPLPLDTQK